VNLSGGSITTQGNPFMNKISKIIVSIIIAVVMGYLAYFYFSVIRKSHSHNRKTFKQYMWIFKDSIRNDIDTNYCFSYVQKQDVYNNFNLNLNMNYNIIIWEFKTLKKISINDVSITKNKEVSNESFDNGEIINAESNFLPITIKNDYSFKKLVKIEISNDSKIENWINGINYKGFYGKINRIALRNGDDESQIFLDYYHPLTPTLFLVFRGHSGFYLIIINNYKSHPIDPNILNILNLK
jgi:phosphate/sulfate permease